MAKSSRTIGELGIGADSLARLTGVILEDNKIYGSTHIAFGANDDFGGVTKARSHIDRVTPTPEAYLDDVLVAKDGKLLARGGDFLSIVKITFLRVPTVKEA